jgi:hypothetical protein
MHRFLLLFALVFAFVASRADAIEMFTNFHNGENIGFPPMQVPIDVYGHGGWRCSARCPQRINAVEPVPAMSPVGFVSCDHAARPYEQQVSQSGSVSQVQYISDRRRSWGRSGDAPSSNYSNNNYSNNYSSQDSGDSSAPQNPTLAKPAQSTTDATQPAGKTQPNDDAKKPVSVFAKPGLSPENQTNRKNDSSSTGQKNQTPVVNPEKSSRRNSDNLLHASGVSPPPNPG